MPISDAKCAEKLRERESAVLKTFQDIYEGMDSDTERGAFLADFAGKFAKETKEAREKAKKEQEMNKELAAIDMPMPNMYSCFATLAFTVILCGGFVGAIVGVAVDGTPGTTPNYGKRILLACVALAVFGLLGLFVVGGCVRYWVRCAYLKFSYYADGWMECGVMCSMLIPLTLATAVIFLMISSMNTWLPLPPRHPPAAPAAAVADVLTTALNVTT